MREFFRSVKFKIFVVVACVLVGLMLRTAATGGLPTATQNAVSMIMSPFQTASSYVSNAFSGLISDITSIGSLKAQNQKLKKEITGLQSQLVDYNELKRENEQLNSLVDMTKENDSRKYAAAMIISRDNNQWFSSFTIDKGTLAGVHNMDPVITSEGLVGVVMTANLSTSVVSTVLDPSVHVGCIVSQTGDTGITHGQRDLSSKDEFEMSYLTKSSSVTTGNIIVTTGDSGMFPKNLRVGIVQDIGPDVSGNSINAILKPMVDPSTVKDVFVITDFSGKDSTVASSSSPASSKGGK